MVRSNFRPEVELWPLCACAVKNTQYNPYLWPNRRNLHVIQEIAVEELDDDDDDDDDDEWICTAEQVMGQWVKGQWVKWVTVFDGSHGSWVTSCLPMTHQPHINSVFSNRLSWGRRCQHLQLNVSDISVHDFNAKNIITSQRNMMFPDTV